MDPEATTQIHAVHVRPVHLCNSASKTADSYTELSHIIYLSTSLLHRHNTAEPNSCIRSLMRAFSVRTSPCAVSSKVL